MRNLGDGDGVEVEWNTDNPLPEDDWYFWTSRSTVWGLRPSTWKSKAPIAFTLEGVEQDHGRFLPNHTGRRSAAWLRTRYPSATGQRG